MKNSNRILITALFVGALGATGHSEDAPPPAEAAEVVQLPLNFTPQLDLTMLSDEVVENDGSYRLRILIDAQNAAVLKLVIEGALEIEVAEKDYPQFADVIRRTILTLRSALGSIGKVAGNGSSGSVELHSKEKNSPNQYFNINSYGSEWHVTGNGTLDGANTKTAAQKVAEEVERMKKIQALFEACVDYKFGKEKKFFQQKSNVE